jgi:NADP-dependent aldehyde dehydrogenase
MSTSPLRAETQFSEPVAGEPAPVLIAGAWRASTGCASFHALSPQTGAALGCFPVSPWEHVAEALAAGTEAFEALRQAGPWQWAAVLDRLADRLETRADELVDVAHEETALAKAPRLRDVELPRTTDQLRQAADAARSLSWRAPTLDPDKRIASYMAPIPGVVAVFGPNNFPFAFNAVAGGDFAAALASGHPVLAKANPGHPGTTRLLAEEAARAVEDVGAHAATVQLLYQVDSSDGLRLVADERVAATAFTGSRQAGLALKSAADAAGRPIYLEMSSVNPVVVLAGAGAERGGAIAAELADSMSMAVGQFCTSPGLVFTVGEAASSRFASDLAARLATTAPGPLLGPNSPAHLDASVESWREAGASVVWASEEQGTGAWWRPTRILGVRGREFLARSTLLQREAFGNAALLVSVDDLDQLGACLATLEGSLTGTVYTAGDGSDDPAYRRVAAALGPRVGRLVHNKPPTGVAVVAAMNHGGPYPSTGHPGFTAVGVPGTLRRFLMLRCFDNADDRLLPPELQAANPLKIQRWVGGRWTDAPVEWG